VKERHHGLPSPYGVVVLLLRVADFSHRVDGAVSTADDKKVVVAVVDHSLDQRPCVVVGCGEKLHSGRDGIESQKGHDDGVALLLQV
jgi:hypothetical protein